MPELKKLGHRRNEHRVLMETRETRVIDCFSTMVYWKVGEWIFISRARNWGTAIFIPPIGAERLQGAKQHHLVVPRAAYTKPASVHWRCIFTGASTMENQCNQALPPEDHKQLTLTILTDHRGLQSSWGKQYTAFFVYFYSLVLSIIFSILYFIYIYIYLFVSFHCIMYFF